MWPGPYGQGGGSRKYVLASLDQSLQRMGLDYVDIFYSPPPRPDDAARGDDGRAGHRRPVGEGAVRRHLLLLAAGHAEARRDPAPTSGRRCSSTSRRTRCSTAGSRPRGCSTRSSEVGAGCIAFSPLAQGMLTDKYLDGVPEGSRASQDKSLSTDLLTEEALDPRPRAERDRAATAGRAWPSSRWPGRCATRG